MKKKIELVEAKPTENIVEMERERASDSERQLQGKKLTTVISLNYHVTSSSSTTLWIYETNHKMCNQKMCGIYLNKQFQYVFPIVNGPSSMRCYILLELHKHHDIPVWRMERSAPQQRKKKPGGFNHLLRMLCVCVCVSIAVLTVSWAFRYFCEVHFIFNISLTLYTGIWIYSNVLIWMLTWMFRDLLRLFFGWPLCPSCYFWFLLFLLSYINKWYINVDRCMLQTPSVVSDELKIMIFSFILSMGFHTITQLLWMVGKLLVFILCSTFPPFDAEWSLQ